MNDLLLKLAELVDYKARHSPTFRIMFPDLVRVINQIRHETDQEKIA